MLSHASVEILLFPFSLSDNSNRISSAGQKVIEFSSASIADAPSSSAVVYFRRGALINASVQQDAETIVLKECMLVGVGLKG
jgi:hypothetical protein